MHRVLVVSHYSAPLHRGVPSTSNTVQCPWHDAEFDLETGKCIGGKYKISILFIDQFLFT